MSAFFIGTVCLAISVILLLSGFGVAGALFGLCGCISFCLYKRGAPPIPVNPDVHRAFFDPSRHRQDRSPALESVDPNQVWQPELGLLVVRQIFSNDGWKAILQYAKKHGDRITNFETIAFMENLSSQPYFSVYREMHHGVEFQTANGGVSLQYASDSQVASFLFGWQNIRDIPTWIEQLSHECPGLAPSEIERIQRIGRERLWLPAAAGSCDLP